MHAPATNVLQDDGITGAREAKTRWHAAVRCAAVLQLHAVIRTQRMTPEHVVSDNLGRMQRLVNRKKDRADLKQLVRLVASSAALLMLSTILIFSLPPSPFRFERTKNRCTTAITLAGLLKKQRARGKRKRGGK